MRRTLKVHEGVRDGRGRLSRLLLVGGSELQALTTKSPALILPVQVLVMSLPFVELLDI